MYRLAPIFLATAALLLSADAPGALRAEKPPQGTSQGPSQSPRQTSSPAPRQLPGDSLPPLPKAQPGDSGDASTPSGSIDQPGSDNSPADTNPAKKTSTGNPPSANAPAVDAQAGPLQPMSRLSLVRFVDGEIVQVVRAIPAGKKGFHMKAGAQFNENALRMAVASAGSAINPGDRAQITNLDF